MQDFDAWVQRKLGEVVKSFDYGLNASAKEYDGINKYLRITDINDDSRTFNKSGLTSPDIDLNNANNYLLQERDLLFARTGASVGKSYRYQSKDGKVYYAGFLIQARIKSDFDINFIFQNTLTSNYENFIRITSQRSGQPGVNATEYASFILNIPSKIEQTKIGNFFNYLDHLIALNQRKLEQLKKLKAGYLQKVFN